MITELTKAVIAKHGPLLLKIDDQGRFLLSRLHYPKAKVACCFGLGSCLIKMLAEPKIDETTPCYICESKPCVCKGDKK